MAILLKYFSMTLMIRRALLIILSKAFLKIPKGHFGFLHERDCWSSIHTMKRFQFIITNLRTRKITPLMMSALLPKEAPVIYGYRGTAAALPLLIKRKKHSYRIRLKPYLV